MGYSKYVVCSATPTPFPQGHTCSMEAFTASSWKMLIRELLASTAYSWYALLYCCFLIASVNGTHLSFVVQQKQTAVVPYQVAEFELSTRYQQLCSKHLLF